MTEEKNSSTREDHEAMATGCIWSGTAILPSSGIFLMPAAIAVDVAVKCPHSLQMD